MEVRIRERSGRFQRAQEWFGAKKKKKMLLEKKKKHLKEIRGEG